MEKKERVLIIGAAGVFGRFLVKASLALGHLTFLLFRPQNVSDVDKCQLFMNFKMDGAHILQHAMLSKLGKRKGSLDDYESLIRALTQVDVVVSTIGGDSILKQLKLIEAIDEVRTIKFGMDVDRLVHKIPHMEQLFIQKKAVRKAIENVNIPYTYISANCMASFFIAGLGEISTFLPPRDKVQIYGQGDIKTVLVAEEDIAMYTMLSISDSRTLNKIVYFRPKANILSQMELINIWEILIGKHLEKTSVSEEEWLNKLEKNERHVMGHFQVYFKGACYFEIEGSHGKDTNDLFSDYKYVTAEEYLKRFIRLIANG